MVIRRPAVGYVMAWTTGRDLQWRQVRAAVYAYDIATATWALVFAARFVVQRLLYNADQTGWLGVSRIAMACDREYTANEVSFAPGVPW